nr:subtilisin-like protease SBT5.3 [Tanacetum cinerariifolium]
MSPKLGIVSNTFVKNIVTKSRRLYGLILLVTFAVGHGVVDRKHYIVYMGQHSHPSSESVISANHEMLTSVLKSYNGAKQATIHHYTKSFRGFSAMLTPDEASKLLGENVYDAGRVRSFYTRITYRTFKGVQFDTFTAEIPSCWETILKSSPDKDVDFLGEIPVPSGFHHTIRKNDVIYVFTSTFNRKGGRTKRPSPKIFIVRKGDRSEQDVMATLSSKEIKERSKAKGDDGEGLYVRRRTYRRDSRYVKKDEQPSSSGSTYDDSELGDNKECKIRGIGKVRVQLKDGSSFVLHNVRYILEWERNLISLKTLEKEGYTVKLQSGKVKVINGSRVILFGIRSDNCIYSLDGHAMEGGYGFISSSSNMKLRMDNGHEFYNREFEQLCIDSEIARHLTVFETPQQNGVAERMNKTLMDK